jgi:hypothetical protein
MKSVKALAHINGVRLKEKSSFRSVKLSLLGD